jgi:hypothetical protein
MNTIYFSRELKNLKKSDAEALRQLDWLNKTLASSDKKFLITMHIFPGLNFFEDKYRDSPI